MPSWLYRLTFAVSLFHVWIVGLQRNEYKTGSQRSSLSLGAIHGMSGLQRVYLTYIENPNPACNNSVCMVLFFLLVHENGVNRYR